MKQVCKHADYRHLAGLAATSTIESVERRADLPPHNKTILNQELRKRELGT